MTDRRKQVADQCRAVGHMAGAIKELYEQQAAMFDRGSIDDLIEQVGQRTASFMEKLGDMLNATDAVSEEDEWVNPIMEEAQRLWPTTQQK